MTAMTERPAAFRLVALLLLVLAAGGLACVAAALSALFLSSAPLHTDTIFALTGVGPTIVGAVLVVRRPGNMVGRLLVLIGSTWSLGEAGRVYLWVQVHAGPLPVTDLAAWFVSWAFAPAWLLVLFLLPVFPHGRVASSWMRWPVRVAIPAVLTLTLLGMFLPDELEAYGTYLIGVTNPWAIVSQPDSPVIDVLEMGPIGPLAILAALGPLDLIRRWRKSEGVERLQMRSLALGVLVTVLLLIAGGVLFAIGFPQIFENLMVVLAINAVPVAVGVAVARYRLYDIDRIINRTLVYGLLTASLTAVYFVSIILLGGVARALTGQSSDLVIAASTLGVAALFRPLRSRFQSTVDRRFYRPKYDADQTLTAFSSAARESVDIADLTSRMGQVIDTTIKPRHFSIWLREPEVRSR